MQQATTQETLVEASQLLLWFMYACVTQQAAQMLRRGLWHDRQFASQRLEHSSEEPVQAPPMNVGESFAATALVHVCMYVWFGHLWLLLSIKFEHITCF